ncbi:MAG: hypothetical protein H6807_02740 [Planctomycetes bacterium]|nr:hypothetical protein [Planctomycetota bacterium]
MNAETEPVEVKASRRKVALIVSLVGIATLGFVAPAGFIISLMALRERPRGMAVTSLLISIAGLVLGAYILLSGIDKVHNQGIFIDIELKLGEYHQDNGRYPTPAEFLVRFHDPQDAWGHPIRYQLVGEKYELRSAGPDGIYENADDFTGGPDPK